MTQGGTAALVAMRKDLLSNLRSEPGLKPLDSDLRHLLGFLVATACPSPPSARPARAALAHAPGVTVTPIGRIRADDAPATAGCGSLEAARSVRRPSHQSR
jgi:hypothetical protein